MPYGDHLAQGAPDVLLTTGPWPVAAGLTAKRFGTTTASGCCRQIALTTRPGTGCVAAIRWQNLGWSVCCAHWACRWAPQNIWICSSPLDQLHGCSGIQIGG